MEFFNALRRFFRHIYVRLFGKAAYYINGSDTLPPPLKEEEEERLIRRLPCEDARCALIEHNLRLVVYIAKKFENTGAGIEELISIGTVGLIKAVSTFNAEKNIKIATYASRCIENEILMFIRKNVSRRRKFPLTSRSASIGTETSFFFPIFSAVTVTVFPGIWKKTKKREFFWMP